MYRVSKALLKRLCNSLTLRIMRSLFVLFLSLLLSLPSFGNGKNRSISKIDSLNRKAFVMLSQDPNKGKNLSDQALKIAFREDYSNGISDCYVNMSLYHYYSGRPDSAIIFIDRASEYSSEDIYRATKIVLNKGGFLYSQCDYATALQLFKKANEIATQNGFSDIIASASLNIGLIYEHYGNLDKSIEMLFKSLEQHEKLGDYRNQILAIINIANIYSKHKKFHEALEYYFKASDLLKEKSYDRRFHANVLMNIGNLYQEIKDFPLSFNFYRQALDIYQEIKDNKGVSGCLNNLGSLYSLEGDYPKAIELQNRSLQIKELVNDTKGIVHCMVNLSEAYFNNGQIDKGFKVALTAFEKADQIKYREVKASAAQLLYEEYSKTNDHKNAYKYLLIYSDLKDSLYDEKSDRIAEDIRIKYEVEKKESELQFKEEQIVLLNQKRNMQFVIQISVIVVILLVTAFGILLYRNRVQKKLISVYSEQGRLHEELQESDKELSTFAMRISQKNDFLEVLRKKIQEIYDKAVNPEAKSLVVELGNLVSINLNLEKDREDFQKYFSQIDNAFLKNLKEKYSDLTDDEQRLCVYLRLNLSSKEISTQFNISAKSVNMKRYRLRKKLDIQGDIGLHEFLSEI